MNAMRKATLLLAGSLVACAPGATTGTGGTSPVNLAYRAQSPPLTYQSADSGTVTMDIPGMGPMHVTFGVSTTSQLSLAVRGDALEATVALTQLSGQTQNPQTGTVGADNSLIPSEPARLTLTRSGQVTEARLPELSRTLREVTSGSTLYRGLFVRLPSTPVLPGASWVDTVRVSDQLGALNTSLEHEFRTTYTGDTVVAGRKLARLNAAIVTRVQVAGDAGGMQIEQRLAGQGTQLVLWDAARSALVYREVDTTATGSMTVVGAGMGDIPVTQRMRSVTRLDESR